MVIRHTIVALLFAAVASAQPARFVSGGPSLLTPAGDQVFFTAYSPAWGQELWRTDGTAEGTRMVRDLTPGLGSSFINQISAGDGVVYFVRQLDPFRSWELWKTDGTAAGTTLVASDPQSSIRLFGATRNGIVYGTESYTTGSLRTATLAAGGPGDPRPRTLGAGFTYFPAFTLGGEVFFLGTTGVWRSDGTPEGTRQHFPTTTGKRLFAARGSLYLLESDGPLWHLPIDGAAVRLATPVIGDFVEVVDGTDAFFIALEVTPGRLALWKSDGTVGGTTRVFTSNGWDRYSGIGRAGEFVLFRDFSSLVAFDSKSAVKRDLRSAGGFQHASLGPLMIFDGPGPGGKEPCRSDGTPEGTVLVRDIAPEGGADPRNFVTWRDMVLFVATDRYGTELWRTDGTAAGTRMVANIGAESVIEGRVTEFATGKPIAGVRIDVYANYFGQRRPFLSVVTDADGRYRFDTLVPADYVVHTFNTLGFVDRESVVIYLDPESTVVQDFGLRAQQRRRAFGGT